MNKTIQVRIPLTMYREISRIKKQMERENKVRFGRNKPVTLTKAAGEYHRRRTKNFFGGSLI